MGDASSLLLLFFLGLLSTELLIVDRAQYFTTCHGLTARMCLNLTHNTFPGYTLCVKSDSMCPSPELCRFIREIIQAPPFLLLGLTCGCG